MLESAKYREGFFARIQDRSTLEAVRDFISQTIETLKAFAKNDHQHLIAIRAERLLAEQYRQAVKAFEGKESDIREGDANSIRVKTQQEIESIKHERRGKQAYDIENVTPKASLIDVVRTLYSKGREFASQQYQMKFFEVAKTPDFMKHIGLTGNKFTIRYGVIARHFGKDDSHRLSEVNWEKFPDSLQKPFAITRIIDNKDFNKSFRLYTTLQNHKGENIVVGVDVKNVGRDLEVNAISTLFGRRENAFRTFKEEVIHIDENITPEQKALLNRPNSDQYPFARELSIHKGKNSASEKQAKSVKSSEVKRQGEIDGTEPTSNGRYSLRTEEPPKKVKTAYAAYRVKVENGKPRLFPMMIKDGSVGEPPLTWLNADTARLRRDGEGNLILNSKGRVSITGKGSPLAWRPGKHLCDYPNASQFFVTDKDGNAKSATPDDVIFFEVEYAADNDYQTRAMEYGMNAKGSYAHSQAGLPEIPKDGFYKYRTNASPDIPSMIITGAYRIKRALTDAEAQRINGEFGGEWQPRLSGRAVDAAKLKEMGLDAEGLDKLKEDFEWDRVPTAHDESASVLADAPGYVPHPLNFSNDALQNAFRENRQDVNVYADGYSFSGDPIATIGDALGRVGDVLSKDAKARLNGAGIKVAKGNHGATLTAMAKAVIESGEGRTAVVGAIREYAALRGLDNCIIPEIGGQHSTVIRDHPSHLRRISQRHAPKWPRAGQPAPKKKIREILPHHQPGAAE